MNNSKRWFSIALLSGLAILVLVGLLAAVPALAQGPGGGMMGGGMMGNPGWMTLAPARSAGVGNTQGFTGTTPFGSGGMMGGMMSQMMNGMMGGMTVNSNSPFFSARPLPLAEATDTLNAYLTSLNDNNLQLGEVMIFDNHAYVQIVEKDSGIGVMEVLVDPTTKSRFSGNGANDDVEPQIWHDVRLWRLWHDGHDDGRQQYDGQCWRNYPFR